MKYNSFEVETLCIGRAWWEVDVFLYLTWIVSRKSIKIDKFVCCTIVIDYGQGTSSFRIIQKYRIVTLGLGINHSQIWCRSFSEDPSGEGTLLVVL